jgi:hypothetical protein
MIWFVRIFAVFRHPGVGRDPGLLASTAEPIVGCNNLVGTET